MKLEKGNKIVNITHFNVYKFCIKFMMGDSDGWDYVYLYISPENKYIERFITFLDSCKNAYPHGRGGVDNYETKVPEWEVFCGFEDFHEEDEEDEELAQFCFDWPLEIYSDIQMTFRSYTITYFDDSGVEYEVNVQK